MSYFFDTFDSVKLAQINRMVLFIQVKRTPKLLFVTNETELVCLDKLEVFNHAINFCLNQIDS